MSAGRLPDTVKLAARFVASVVLPLPPLGFRKRILCISIAAVASFIQTECVQSVNL